MACVIGVDPGFTGALCAVNDGIIIKHCVCPIKKNAHGREFDYYSMGLLFDELKHLDPTVFIEAVNSRPGEGVRSVFNFGMGYGIWVGAAAAHKLKIRFVRPQEWKKEILCYSGLDKQASIDKAKELYPTIKLKPTLRCKVDHHGLAESFLISKYGEQLIN